jgi:hypothetical protein
VPGKSTALEKFPGGDNTQGLSDDLGN